MPWHSPDPDKKRSYHHGNLREALIAAALRLISEKGPAGFTVAEAARAAGVSPAAPYRHFRDREELLADIARRGFETFGASLRAAWDHGRPSSRAALLRLGSAYLHFARTEPAAYAAMFESGTPISNHPALHAVSEDAFAILREACDAVIVSIAPAIRPPGTMVALHIWSLSHGIAALFARGDASRRPLPMSPEDLLEAGVLIYLDGLRSSASA